MFKGRFAQLTSWSFSVYVQYLRCPFSVCLDKIQRIRITEPDSPVLVKGNRAHDIAARYAGGLGKPPSLVSELPPAYPGAKPEKLDLAPIKKKLVELRKRRARTEQEWAFDRQWMPVDWRDWARAWLRIKTDVVADTVDPPTVDIIDWKTGKIYDDHRQQRSLYALGGLRLVQIGALAGGSKDTKLTAQHIYMDTGQTATEEFTLKDLKPLQREWLARIKKMMADTVYPTKTGYHCRYCKYRKSAGGPCPEKM
jgi:RecB family exonuclease